ncbi:MAG: GTPase [Planctomycetota bacterium]
MDLSLEATIAALASPPGSAARGIVRLSGDGVRDVLAGWFEPNNRDCWQSNGFASVHAGVLNLPEARTAIPVEVHLWPNRRSYTGQPIAELHLPGSPPLLEAVLAEAHRRGARPARPGEFTLRAFLAGRLDLLQAEAVLGVIDAHDHTELQAALAQLAGGLSGRLAELRHDLLELLADLEAGLDFIEEDIEFVGRCELIGRIALARRFVDDLLRQSSDRMQSRARAKVVLAGLPNAGKSTLFNRLASRESALVSPREGTTRDFLSAPVDWQGLSFELIDTAGWELDPTGIAQAAQHQRADQLRDADVLLWCSSATLDPPQQELDEQLFAQTQADARCVVRVVTQIDRRAVVRESDDTVPPSVAISAVTGEGLDDLAELLRSRLATSRGPGRQWLGMTAARCRESLAAVAASLARAEEAAESDMTGDELLAIDIREALDHLGRILGEVYTDDILDRVFSKFCIGK